MRRREFIAGLGSATAWPMVARAQQPTTPVIGYLTTLGTQSADDYYTVAFLQGLKETGFIEGQNVAIEYHRGRIKPIGCQRLRPISSAAA